MNSICPGIKGTISELKAVTYLLELGYDAIIELYEKGEQLYLIGEKLSIPYQSIVKHLKKCGLLTQG